MKKGEKHEKKRGGGGRESTTSCLYANQHNHSRQDGYFGSPIPFNQAAWNETIQYWQDEYININTSAAARAARIRTSNATNPDFGLSSLAKGFSSGESIAPIMVFGNVTSGVVDAQTVKYWFGECCNVPSGKLCDMGSRGLWKE